MGLTDGYEVFWLNGTGKQGPSASSCQNPLSTRRRFTDPARTEGPAWSLRGVHGKRLSETERPVKKKTEANPQPAVWRRRLPETVGALATTRAWPPQRSSAPTQRRPTLPRDALRRVRCACPGSLHVGHNAGLSQTRAQGARGLPSPSFAANTPIFRQAEGGDLAPFRAMTSPSSAGLQPVLRQLAIEFGSQNLVEEARHMNLRFGGAALVSASLGLAVPIGPHPERAFLRI